MQIALLMIFAVVALAPVAWALWRPKHFVEFPVLTGGAWAGYVLPQAIGLYQSSSRLPGIMFDAGFGRSVLMCILCSGLGYLGYRFGRLRRPVSSFAPVSPERLWFAGAVCAGIATLGALRLTALSGGVVQFFSLGGAYALEWRGAPVMYVFFVDTFIYPALLLLGISYLLKPKRKKALALAVAGLWPLAAIFLMARRSVVVYAFLLIALSFRLVRGWSPPRLVLAAAVALLMTVVVVFPEYRKYSQIGAEHGEIAQIRVVDQLTNVFTGEQATEFANTVGLVAAASITGDHMLGAYHYNYWMKHIVPRQLVGEEIKDALYVGGNFDPYKAVTIETLGWERRAFEAISAAAGLYIDFWYFGALAYFVLGFICRRIYERVCAGSTRAMLVYSFVILLVPHTIATGFATFLPKLFYAAIFFVPVLYYIRLRRRVSDARVQQVGVPLPAPEKPFHPAGPSLR